MKYKKTILWKKILLSTPIIAGTIMTTVVCRAQTKFNSYDLSTWRREEKLEISNTIISTIKKYYGDYYWNNLTVPSGTFDGILSAAFQIINPNASFYQHWDVDKNISWNYVNDQPNDNPSVKDVLKKGLSLLFKGIDDGFVGEITTIFKDLCN